VALEREDGPTALLLSRQNVLVLDRDEVADARGVERGAYVLWDSAGSDPEIVMIATGAELPLTFTAGKALAERGVRVRVVSMPCMDLFEEQSREYRDEVLPPAVRTRLAVEPGATISWGKWVGLDGDVLGLDRFGASAPGNTVLKELGFTAENILGRASALLEAKH
jgi:transketolase